MVVGMVVEGVGGGRGFGEGETKELRVGGGTTIVALLLLLTSEGQSPTLSSRR